MLGKHSAHGATFPALNIPLRGEGSRDGEAFSNALGGGGTCTSLQAFLEGVVTCHLCCPLVFSSWKFRASLVV